MESAQGQVEPTPTPQQAPTNPPPAEPPHSATPLILTVVVAVLVGAGGLTFTMVNSRANAASVVSAGRSTASTNAPTQPATAQAQGWPAGPHWSQAGTYRWVANHRRSAAYELESRELVPVWTTNVRPTLVVRCLAKKTDVFVYIETAARIESDENHTVGLAFDGDKQMVERWPDSEEHDALFAPDSGALATRLATAHHLAFTFTPHNAQPVTVNFDLTGADGVVASVRKTCGGK